MQTILASIDFSPVSRQVVDGAVELARSVNARVVLLHIVQPPMVATELAPFVGDVIKFTTGIEQAARRHLRRWQSSLARRGIRVDVICEQGSPVPLIIAHAKKLGARYIVLGSHGHTAFYDLMVGSTASGVLKRSTCPVVVVPSPKKEKARRSRPRTSTRRVI